MLWLVDKILKRIDWEWHKYKDYIYRKCVRPPYVMSYEECVDYIIDNKASLSRMGDGELAVIYGSALGFQSQNLDLAKRLEWVMTQDSKTLLLCIPDTFEKLERYNIVEQNFWRAHHYYNRKRWYKHLKSGKQYGNTFLSRFYSMEFEKDLSAHRITLLKKLWDKRDVIFVEGKDTKMGVGNDLFDNAKSIRRILCPSKDAFASYDRIVEYISKMNHMQNDLYILALGPTATVMAVDLHDIGLQALDLGHMDIEYEWYLRGVKEKVPIKGKFSNESLILGLANDAVSGCLISDDYDRQIVVDFSQVAN